VAPLTLFLTAAIALLVIGLVACVGLVLMPPLMILCIVGATAAFAAFTALTWNIYESCIANCQEAGGGA
jgi:hypothetical protein